MTPTEITRRGFALALAASAAVPTVAAAAPEWRDQIGMPLSPWRPGELDIHVLSTGRGDAALLVSPRGRTLLIDAGAADSDPASMVPAKPEGVLDPADAISSYLLRRLRDTGGTGLDVLYVTHLHGDHMAAVPRLAATMPIGRIIDPDYPDYQLPFEIPRQAEPYVRYIRARAAAGGTIERLQVGRADQFGLEPLEVRAVAGRGVVWTGEGDGTRRAFPPASELAPADRPNENAAGTAIRVRYAGFSAFFAGDLTDWADGGARPWMDVLSSAAEIAGPVDVALAPHHGLYDASGFAMTRALSPAIWIISTWHTSQPSRSTLERLLNTRINPRIKGVYANGIGDAAAIISERALPRLACRRGNVVVRVDASGRYRVVVTEDEDESDRVLSKSETFFR